MVKFSNRISRLALADLRFGAREEDEFFSRFLGFLKKFSRKLWYTRMHSSRMRTVRCSGRLSCHTCPPSMHVPSAIPPCHTCPCHVCPPPSPATHAYRCHACPSAMDAPRHVCPCHACPHPAMHVPTAMHTPATNAPLPCMPPRHARPYGQNDRRLWKRYLSATTVVDGRYGVDAASRWKFWIRHYLV